MVLSTNCRVCTGRYIVAGVNDLKTLHPKIAKQWDHSKNTEDINTIPFLSKKKIWWICEKDERHTYQSAISDKVRKNTQCSVCCNVTIIPGINDFETEHPEIAKELSRNNEDLKILSKRSPKSSRTTVNCICNKKHEYMMSLRSRANGQGCPTCAESGFSREKAGILYFIEHPIMKARKIGITNLGAKKDRLSNFKKQGWTILFSIEHYSGYPIKETERLALKWIRKDIDMPSKLTIKDMGHMGGFSETFDIKGISNEKIIAKIQDLFNQQI